MTWEDYTEQELWKCSKSGSGAHFWLVEKSTQRCKYCKEKRTVPLSSK